MPIYVSAFNPVSGSYKSLKALIRLIETVIHLELVSWIVCSFRANSDHNRLWSLIGPRTVHHLPASLIGRLAGFGGFRDTRLVPALLRLNL